MATSTDADFDAALAKAFNRKVTASASAGRKMRPKLQKRLDEQLALARADPVGWTQANRDDIRRGSRRPLIAKRLSEECPEFTEDEHAEFLTAYTDTGVGAFGDWSPEKKLRWHLWIQKAIPILKIIAGLTPPPWNLLVIGIIVLLTIIDENRLQPAELGAIFGSM